MGMFDLGIGGLFKGFKSFMQPEKGYQKAQEALMPYYNQSQDFFRPYQQHGEEAYGNLNTAMQKMLHPVDFQNELMQDYETSPMAQHAMNEARENGLRAASSMGMMGSTPAMSAIQRGTSQIGNEDRYKALQDLINMYTQGATMAQGIYGQGANAGSMMGQNAMNMGNTSAGLAYGRQNAPGSMFNDLLQTAGYAYGNRNGNGNGNPWSTTGGR